MVNNNEVDILVALVTQDPFFLFTAKALLGRYTRTRIIKSVNSLKSLKGVFEDAIGTIHAVVLDLDSIIYSESFFEELQEGLNTWTESKVVCIVGDNLELIAPKISQLPVSALLSKYDLGLCLHLAIRAVMEVEIPILTETVRTKLDPQSSLRQIGKSISHEVQHANMSKRIFDVAIWRFFIGLDNSDIQDELMLENNTVREYVSKAYQTLNVQSEIEGFNAISDWWWVSRFSHLTD